MLRVIAGKYKHRKLSQPPLSITRSTKDSVKEGFFSSIGDTIIGSNFLDLFSGSGAIGIEAYSRGASFVVLNDNSKEAYNIIQKNVSCLGIDSNLIIYNKDYNELLNVLSHKQEKFDFIFLDPPYKMIIDLNFIEKIRSFNILKEKHSFIVETDYLLNKDLLDTFISKKQFKYGKTYVYILRSY